MTLFLLDCHQLTDFVEILSILTHNVAFSSRNLSFGSNLKEKALYNVLFLMFLKSVLIRWLFEKSRLYEVVEVKKKTLDYYF